MPAAYWFDRALRLAARKHKVQKAEILLGRAAEEKEELDMGRTDVNGFTVLHVCMARPADSGDGHAFAKLLLKAKATVNATNMLGETPLILATRGFADAAEGCSTHQLGMIKLMLESSASVNTSDSVLHETPLMEAASIGEPELVLTLLRARADAARSSASGQTAMDFARKDEVKWMLQNPMQVISGSCWPGADRGSSRPKSSMPSPQPTAKPSAAAPRPSPQKSSSGGPRQPLSYAERLQRLLAKYPGFEGSGIELPSHAWQWSDAELELFIGSMGQFWPPGRAKPGARSKPSNGGYQQPGQGIPREPRARPALRNPGALRPHYQALGVPEGTSDRQILKRAYRQAALKWHPDKNPDDPQAAGRFQLACDAYENLCKALGFGAA
eukprot:TRINITY_DN77335_c0_g1_i1.p1 TRINITY_DN77335_c0_g1~~TRINITY_DN77335_c0_g1_i1.p1  ORF type:complete len:448 (-),score=103.28 TRINITY_DN77335_c0_g1_i1:114-1268(-)